MRYLRRMRSQCAPAPTNSGAHSPSETTLHKNRTPKPVPFPPATFVRNRSTIGAERRRFGRHQPAIGRSQSNLAYFGPIRESRPNISRNRPDLGESGPTSPTSGSSGNIAARNAEYHPNPNPQRSFSVPNPADRRSGRPWTTSTVDMLSRATPQTHPRSFWARLGADLESIWGCFKVDPRAPGGGGAAWEHWQPEVSPNSHLRTSIVASVPSSERSRPPPRASTGGRQSLGTGSRGAITSRGARTQARKEAHAVHKHGRAARNRTRALRGREAAPADCARSKRPLRAQ